MNERMVALLAAAIHLSRSGLGADGSRHILAEAEIYYEWLNRRPDTDEGVR